jgi:hypothetical protein
MYPRTCPLCRSTGVLAASAVITGSPPQEGAPSEPGAPLLLVSSAEQAVVADRSSGSSLTIGGGGSIGIIGAARAGMVIAPDPSDAARRVLAMTKCNLAPMPSALAFRLVPDEQYGVAKVKWEGTTSHSASDLLSAPTDDEEKGALGEAVEFLRDCLEDGQRAAKDVLREARDAGVSERTLRRAQKRLKIQPRKVGVPGSDSQRWAWELPEAEDGQQTPKMAKAAKENGWAPSEIAKTKAWPSWQPSEEVGSLREPDFTFDNDIEPCIVCGDPTPVHDPQGRSRHPVCEVEVAG